MIRFLADELLLVILIVSASGALWALRKRALWPRVTYVVMAGLTSLLVAKLASAVYQPSEQRPFVVQGVEAGASFINNPGFPSDHALLAVAAIGAVWFLTSNWRLVGLLACAAVVMMVARVLALVHTPLDIVGGIVAAAIGFLWYAMASKRK